MKTDAPLQTFVVGGYPNEDCEGFMKLMFRDPKAARALAEKATTAAEILEAKKGAAVTEIVAGTIPRARAV